MTERPNHIDVDGNVRPLNDQEYAQWQEDLANVMEPPPPVSIGIADWRIGLMRWDRLEELNARIEALIQNPDPALAAKGKEIRERLDYTPTVNRGTLLALAPAIGFTEADVDESMRRGAAVAAEIAPTTEPTVEVSP